MGKESTVPTWRFTPENTVQPNVLPIRMHSSSLIIFSAPLASPTSLTRAPQSLKLLNLKISELYLRQREREAWVRFRLYMENPTD